MKLSFPTQFFENGFSTAADFDIDGEIEIIHALANVTINIYPNPATSIINLDIEEELVGGNSRVYWFE